MGHFHKSWRPEAAPQRDFVFLGLLPPPIDGQRLVTRMMLEQIARMAPVAVYDLQPRNARFAALAKPLRMLGGIFFLGLKRLSGSTSFYLAPPSGRGILFACVVALAARLLRFRIFVHYHSWKLVAGASRPTAAFVWSCGAEAWHITLAPPMAAALRRNYNGAKRVVALSNSGFFDYPPVPRRTGHAKLRVGHLSNLSKSKGIERVMACAERLEASGLDVEMVLAGPMDDEARQIVEPKLATLTRCRYRGTLAPTEVSSFYSEIDVFLFPTQHPHEAEPLVVLDALAAGVPVIATDRGCIAYLLDETSGSIAVSSEIFVERAIDQIKRWAEDRDALAQASQHARARLETLQATAKAELPAVLQLLCRTSDRSVPAGDYAGGSERRAATER